MRIHYFCAIIILLASLLFNFTKVEISLLSISITLVLISEMINTSIEKTIDAVIDEFNPLAKIAKDVAAGAVLLSSLGASIVGYILFFDNLTKLSEDILNSIRTSSLHITLICIVLVLIAVVVVKALTSTGTPLKGGMPSGHSALAWAIATSITFITQNVIASTLGFVMAFLVSQSRIEGKIHTFWEVVAGGSLGILITILVFQLSFI